MTKIMLHEVVEHFQRESSALLDGVDDPECLDEAGDAIFDCDGAEELLSRARSLAVAS